MSEVSFSSPRPARPRNPRRGGAYALQPPPSHNDDDGDKP